MDTEIAAEGVISETETLDGGMLAEMIKARHALFDDITTVKRDEDDLPEERGVTGDSLQWWPVLGDLKLDKQACNAAWGLQKKHPYSFFDAEDLAQRIRLRLENGLSYYKVKSGLPEDAKLVFELDRGWTKYAQTIIRNECARYAEKMERECQEHLRLISRDGRGEKDVNGDEQTWRENLDFAACQKEFDRDELQQAIEAALALMPECSRRLLERYYREGVGLRTLATERGMALSSFQNGPWKQAKADFAKNFHFFLVR